MTQYDDEIPEGTFNDDAGLLLPRRRYRMVIQSETDEIGPYQRYRWWHVVGAVFLVFVMLAEVLLPVIHGILDLMRFVPAGGGQPL